MTFDKDAKIVQWGKSSLFNNWCWGNCTQWNKAAPTPCSTAYSKINSKWGKPKHKSLICKLLEGNTGEIPHDIGFGNESMDVTPKHRQKEKNGWISSKLRSFVHQRIPSREWKGSQTNGEKNLQILCLKSRIYRELLQLNDKKQSNSKMGQELEQKFPKKICR